MSLHRKVLRLWSVTDCENSSSQPLYASLIQSAYKMWHAHTMVYIQYYIHRTNIWWGKFWRTTKIVNFALIKSLHHAVFSHDKHFSNYSMLSVSSPFVAEAKLYVSVFIDIERSVQLQSYYSQCHKVINIV